MKKILFLLSVLFLGVFGLNAQVEQADQTTKTATESSENALLWEISGKDLKAPSYLFGTIHMIDKENFFWPEGTMEALDASDRVTFEINMEEIDMLNIGTMMEMLQGAMMKNGMTLKQLLSEEDYQFVSNKFNEMGMPLFMLERVKPMFLTVFASGDMEMGGFQTGEIKSYEMEFMALAKEKQKEMGGLETVEFQMSVFDSIPYKDQADMLVEALKMEGGEGEGQFEEMVKLYREQNVEALQNSISDESQGLSKYERILLQDRNTRWIPIMEEQMSDKTTLFAVGAGHLGGEEGVINLLKKAGYTMTPISNK